MNSLLGTPNRVVSNPSSGDGQVHQNVNLLLHFPLCLHRGSGMSFVASITVRSMFAEFEQMSKLEASKTYIFILGKVQYLANFILNELVSLT